MTERTLVACRKTPKTVTVTALLLGLSIFPLHQGAEAQNAPDQSLVDEFNDRVNEAVNGVTIFTTQNTASSGALTLDSNGQGDSDQEIDILKVPISYTFGQEGEEFRPHVRGVIGNFQSSYSPASQVPGGTADYSELDATTVGASGGMTWSPIEQLKITPLFELAWTRLDRNYDFNNTYSQTNFKPFDRDAFNTSVDVLTYSPSLEADYTLKDGETSYTPKIRYAHLFNDSVSSDSSVIDVNQDSGLLQTFFEVNTPLGYSLFCHELGLRPFIIRTDIFGAAKDARGPNYFHELGLHLTFNRGSEYTIKGFSLGASYIVGHDLTGYRLGIGLDL
jgi:hypothetical protein